MSEQQKFLSVKLIGAVPLTRQAYNQLRGWTMPADENGEDAGYMVRYPDGYISWSPAAVFEESSRPADAMSFGHAVEALKLGNKVARKGWNGKGMFLWYVPAGKYPARMEAIKGHYPCDLVPYSAYIAMKAADGAVVPWLASQTDVLAEDWEIIV